MTFKLVPFAAAFGFGVALVAGCGGAGKDTGPETVSVSGKVQLDGTPSEGAEVNFLTENYAGIAYTKADGTYQLEAEPGENKVYIRKFEGIGPDADPTMLPAAGDPEAAAGGPRQLVPAKYSDPEKTELKFTVPEKGADNADFELTSP